PPPVRCCSLILSAEPAAPESHTLSLHDALPIFDLAVRAGLDGVFNVAPDGWISGDEARALSGSPRLPLPERLARRVVDVGWRTGDRKSTRLNSSHRTSSYAVLCLKKKKSLSMLR